MSKDSSTSYYVKKNKDASEDCYVFYFILSSYNVFDEISAIKQIDFFFHLKKFTFFQRSTRNFFTEI